MTRIESKLVVSKSIEETFSFLSTSANHLKIIPRAVAFEQTSAGTFGQPGATATGTIRYFGLNMNVDYEIFEHKANQRLAMKGKLGPLNFKDGYILSSAPNGTQISFWLELTLNGVAKLLAPFAWLVSKVHAYETLRNLKRELAR